MKIIDKSGPDIIASKDASTIPIGTVFMGRISALNGGTQTTSEVYLRVYDYVVNLTSGTNVYTVTQNLKVLDYRVKNATLTITDKEINA